jgi:hypothetical protein
VTDSAEFARCIRQHLAGVEYERATASLRTYCQSFTGRWFQALTDRSPNRVTANDIVAVSMLGVDVPAPVSAWLLREEGERTVTTHLRMIEPCAIWDDRADLSPDGHAWSLSNLLRERHGMGRTTTAKLLAAKRPDMIPVYDSYVARALGIDGDNDWQLWQTTLSSPSGNDIRDTAAQLRDEAGADASVSVLRTLDIIVWMRHHGCADAPRDAGLNYTAATPLGE